MARRNFDIDEAIKKANKRLREDGVRLSIEKRCDRLVLRGTLPPRPGSDKTAPHRQRIPLGRVFASEAGLRAARKLARKVADQIEEGTFQWAHWLSDLPETRKTSAWVASFKKDYFERRGKDPKTKTTWDKDYQVPFNRLPPNVPLLSDLMREKVLSIKPNTRSRERYVMAYNALAKFAGIDCDLTPLKGSYSSKAVNPRDIPSDALILEWSERIPGREWQWVFKLMATYGIRNHECWYMDLARLIVNPTAIIHNGKTGPREAVAGPPDWWDQWFYEQEKIELPKLTVKCNSDYGRLSAQYFKRLKLPFCLYDLRHAYATRLGVLGIDSTLVALYQGHSTKVHEQIYLQFMNDEHHRDVTQQLRDRYQRLRDSGGVQ